MSTCARNMYRHEIKLIVKQILCIKLVKYWDKYTKIHGQQNVKILINGYCCISLLFTLLQQMNIWRQMSSSALLGLLKQNRVSNKIHYILKRWILNICTQRDFFGALHKSVGHGEDLAVWAICLFVYGSAEICCIKRFFVLTWV